MGAVGGILGGVTGLIGGYSNARSASKEFNNQRAILEAQAGPRTTTRSPWAPTEETLIDALNRAYNQVEGNFTQNALRGVRGIPGASPETRNLLGEIEARAGSESPTMGSAHQFVQDRLGGGLNPITSDLYGRLGNASFDRAGDLLMGFLDQGQAPRSPGLTPRAPSGQPQGPAAPGRSAGLGTPRRASRGGVEGYPGIDLSRPATTGRQSSPGLSFAEARGRQAQNARGGVAGAGGGASTPGTVPASAAREIPDSMAVDSFFSRQARDFFDPSRLDPANDPTVAPYVDALRADMEKQAERRAAALNDQFSGLNSFNSSARALSLGEAAGESERGLASELARFYLGAREGNLGRQMNLLGQISGRDLAAMGDRTARHGIDTQARTAREASSSAAANARMLQDAELAFRREQLAQEGGLANRGLDLRAIQSMMEMDQFGLGQLGDLGQQMDAGQIAALGSVPSLESIPLDYYRTALGGRGAADVVNQRAGENRQAIDIQSRLGPATDLDRYLSQVLGPASGFGTTVTEGTAPTGLKDPSPNPWVAALTGGIGGAMSGFFGGG